MAKIIDGKAISQQIKEELLEPYMGESDGSRDGGKRPKVVIATVKGDVHDIGKNITAIVLTCNGFDVHDLGVMVDRDTILSEAERLSADIVAVSGLITPSLYQMEELCRAMASKGMSVPLMIGGATTSALHTAVKLAPLYEHVFYGADASAAAVLAKKYIMDPEAFEAEQHAAQKALRDLYMTDKAGNPDNTAAQESDRNPVSPVTSTGSAPSDIPVTEIPASEVLPYFDWKMFYAIWGVRYGSAVPEAMELIQLRKDAEDELFMENFRIRLAARFFMGGSDSDEIVFADGNVERKLPFMRQETGNRLSLCDFVASGESGCMSPFGIFAISVHTASKTHEEGCCCPACSNRYEDLIGKTVRLTLAEAASCWLDRKIREELKNDGIKVIKPAAGYASCPDHTLKEDILKLLGEDVHPHDCHGHSCGCHKHEGGLGISLTESYAMTPEASICGLIFMHPQACYPDIRRISREQYEEYARRRGMSEETARRFLGHLL